MREGTRSGSPRGNTVVRYHEIIDLFYKLSRMSVGKIILVVFIIGVCLFAAAMYLALTPTIKDVSDNVALKKYLNKKLTTKRDALVLVCEEADYNFVPQVLTGEAQGACQEKHKVPGGTHLIIQSFKTYKNANSGFTYLYALGEIEIPTGEKVQIEYNWGSTDLQQFAHKPPHLPLALWQNNDDLRTIFAAN